MDLMVLRKPYTTCRGVEAVALVLVCNRSTDDEIY